MAPRHLLDSEGKPLCRVPSRPFDRLIRVPYVHDDDLAEAYRRSAQIDREEMDCLDSDDPRMTTLRDSAADWDRRAQEV